MTARHIFASGNTARGYFDLYDSVLQNVELVHFLIGGSTFAKSRVIQSVGNRLEENGIPVEYIHSPMHHEQLEGLVLQEQGVAIVDVLAPRHWQPRAIGVIEQYVSISKAFNHLELSKKINNIRQNNEKMRAAKLKAYDTFAHALRIHDEWEKYFISNMDFEKANQVTKETISLLVGYQQVGAKTQAREMFFGAATPSGAVDFIQKLTEHVPKRYFIKGRPGSGKSTMLKKIVSEATKLGLQVDVYHCGFDPNSLDMVVLPEKGFAIFDSTAPHEYFPDRETDEIIDMYSLTINPGTDEEYATQIKEVAERYSKAMKQATAYLKEAQTYFLQNEQIYENCQNAEQLEAIAEDITSSILSTVS
ncbi:hypothetical protein [Brevibacillus sp. SYSU BS000544]|uniref:hypothetical protein n=1 Tax=Brevibacillus sp. SYSU BS000544 TaxID=3416443 RepID=UPI003CE5C0DC